MYLNQTSKKCMHNIIFVSGLREHNATVCLTRQEKQYYLLQDFDLMSVKLLLTSLGML